MIRTLSASILPVWYYAGTDTDQIFYMLEGYDKTWIPAAGNRSIVYSNLDPGHYKLVLGIAEENGKVSIKNVKTLFIRINLLFGVPGCFFNLLFDLFDGYLSPDTLSGSTQQSQATG